MLKGWRKLLLALPILLIAAGGFAAWRAKSKLASPCLGLETDFSCHSKYYEGLTLKSGTKHAFAKLKQQYSQNEFVKSNCHQIVHVIGRATAEKIPDVPQAYNEGDSFCWSGFYHGVLETVSKRIGFKNLPNRINDICSTIGESQRYSHFHYNCVHGLGHGMMFATDNDLPLSLGYCDHVSNDWERESCYGGVFMENVMANVLPEHRTKFLKNDEPFYPCTAVARKYRGQCYLIQPSHALALADNNFERAFEQCGLVEADFRATCYQSMGRDASGSTISDPARTKAICMVAKSADARLNCVIGAVKDIVFYFHRDAEAKVFCELLGPERATCEQIRRESAGQLGTS